MDIIYGWFQIALIARMAVLIAPSPSLTKLDLIVTAVWEIGRVLMAAGWMVAGLLLFLSSFDVAR